MEAKKPLGRMELLGQFAKDSAGFFALALAASAANTVIGSLTPQVIKVTVDSVLGSEPLSLPGQLGRWIESLGGAAFLGENLYLLAVTLLVIAVFSGLCNFTSRVTTAKGSEGMVRRLRNRLYGHIQRLPYRWHVSHQTGDIIQRCTSDVEVVRNFVSSQLLEVFRTAFLIIWAMGIMFSMNQRLTWIALLYVPVIIAYSTIYYSIISKKFRKADEAEGYLSSAVQENLTGVRVVRAFGREAYEIKRFDEKNETYANLWIRLGYTLGGYWGLGDLITGLQIVTIIVMGTVEAVSGSITLGEFIAFVSYNSTLIWPIRGLGRILSEMSKAGVSMDRLAYLLNAEEERDAPDATTPPMDGDLHFDHVSFGYTGGKDVLRDVTFTVPAGSTFAILGGTGSGKSTLMHLLNRLYDLPQENGKISIGGVDIATMRRDWLRQNIGMVLQEPFLFSRTLSENIGVARETPSLDAVRHAAGIACVDEAIQSFPEGYETIVGERGVTLSGGQKQRVAIARMLMQEAPIMVFDDSLSAVDSETDSKIRAALKTQLGRSTVILISHRITTLMQADVILVLDDGKVAQMGTHRELLEQDGIYKHIYDIQMSSDDRIYMEGGEN